MNFFRSNLLSPHSSSSSSSTEEEILIWKILITHDPDGRRLDSELLLHITEDIMFYANQSEELVADQRQVADQRHVAMGNNTISNLEVVGSDELLGNTINKISHEITSKCSGEEDINKRVMILFDLLGKYTWDAKLAIVLSAFALSYGEFWLIMQLNPTNPLAALLAMLKQFPTVLFSSLKLRFKALNLLVNAMVDVAKCVIKFEGLPFEDIKPDNDDVERTKSQIYLATYWVIRSTLVCSCQTKDLVAIKQEQVYSNSTATAVWELSSLLHGMTIIYNRTRSQFDTCHHQIGTKVHHKLLNLFKETHIDNQEVFRILFALKDDLPFKDCSSQAKIGISELKDKVVILLISKAELLPLEQILLLLQQTYDHSLHKKLEGSYAILWVPVSSSNTWTEAEEENFNFLSSIFPWYSIRRLRLLSSAFIKYIKEEWSFKGEPIMVVLDSRGIVTNMNAFDMVFIWGARAFPFSTEREKELWEQQHWTMQLVAGEFDPLLTLWVEQGRNIFFYGGDNLDWIRELNSKIKEITSEGVQLEIVYVGTRNPNEQLRDIISCFNKEKLSGYLSLTKVYFFWTRLDSMKRSKLRFNQNMADTDSILKEVEKLLSNDYNGKNWVLVGKGSTTEITSIEGRKFKECLDRFSKWREDVGKFGFVEALRSFLDPLAYVGSCPQPSVVPYEEGLLEGDVYCKHCKRPKEKFVVYKCDGM